MYILENNWSWIHNTSSSSAIGISLFASTKCINTLLMTANYTNEYKLIPNDELYVYLRECCTEIVITKLCNSDLHSNIFFEIVNNFIDVKTLFHYCCQFANKSTLQFCSFLEFVKTIMTIMESNFSKVRFELMNSCTSDL